MKIIETTNVKGRELQEGDLIVIEKSVVKVLSNNYKGLKVIFLQLYSNLNCSNCTCEVTAMRVAEKTFKKIVNPYTDQLFVINNDVKHGVVAFDE
jgi:ASC-1-like (ASCH) protein